MIRTERLLLRPWRQSDLEPFAQLNADPLVMQYFTATLSHSESDAHAERISREVEEKGWGLWAVELLEEGDFIGAIGLHQVSFQAHFTPAVEVGWRLAVPFWGRGYATEGAKAALQYGFETLQLDQIVSFTTVVNLPSRRVMEKLGMHHDSRDDFDHPKVPPESLCRRHVLYRLQRNEWKEHA